MPKPRASGFPDGSGSSSRSSAGQGHPRLRGAAAGFAAACVALLLAGCTGGQGGPAGSTTFKGTAGGQAPLAAERLELQLNIPWAAVFLPDGTAIISERDTALLKAVPPGGKAIELGKVPGVVAAGEGGLLGLALSPGFASDRYLYAYLTAQEDNRIVRLALEDSGNGRLSLGEPQVIFTGIPKATTHNGGRIRFGPDGFLYVGTGDSQRRNQPQDPEALGGKILRLTPEGGPAPGNPFGNAVYSLGHRNVQGLAWDSAGRLWASEFGPDVNDELNLILPGANYGWPTVTGAPHRPEFQDAKVVWPSTSESSPSGLEIAGSTAYLGALRGQRLWTVQLEGGEAGNPVAHFTREFGRIRDVVRTPEGGFWLLTNNENPDFVLVLPPPE
ncbi:PQQ-dependent sugar dehydrogenase [Arthrobacter sp. BB-1]|uniref:PQQ-dependent sugar dehydrogenase n=1 Tax=unclassified Arthrobacter TaxID=235627 RepID=UPI0011123A5F|nr:MULTISPECIES: PQQ-dependent sugar dehydrogenase [unclassified Arthrobacter]TNB71485.1 PQQ-dependent sugar dehydrogenase [Arthrobacter sp. BB-1]